MKSLIPKSLYWKIQLWYAFLLFIVAGGLLHTFIEVEKDRLYQQFEESLVESSLKLHPDENGGGRRQTGGDLHSPPSPPNRQLHPQGGHYDQPMMHMGGQPMRRKPIGRHYSGQQERFGYSDAPKDPSTHLLRESSDRVYQGDFREGEFREFNSFLGGDKQSVLEDVLKKGHSILAYIGEAVVYCNEEFPEGDLVWKEVVPSQFILKDGVGYYRRSLRGRDHLIIASSDEQVRKEVQAIRIRWNLVGLGCVCLSSLMGGIVLRRALQPITRIRDTAQQIGNGRLDARIGISDAESELGHLSSDLNRTFVQLEKLFAQQVKFTSDASHEMRTPLTVIRTKAQWAMRKERSPDDYKKALHMIDLASKRMQDLTQNLLDLSRLDSGVKKLNKKDVELAGLIQSQILLLSDVAEEKGITITHNISEVVACIDSLSIEQVVLNLLSNAIKYNKLQGTIHVTLSKEASDAVIVVQDTGIGMTPEQAQNMFNRFYQADIARTEESNGLGLAIVKSIIEAHDGIISVTSEIGLGSTMTVKLPC